MRLQTIETDDTRRHTFWQAIPASLRTWQFWLGLGISLVCLVLVFRGINAHELTTALRTADYRWLIPASALLALSLAMRALRWRILFHPQKNLDFAAFFRVLNVTYLANNVLPARAGELIRVGLISTRQPVNAAQALATVVVERVLDGLTLALMLVLLLPRFTVPDIIVRGGQATGSALLVAGLGLLLLATQRERVIRWSKGILRPIPRLNEAKWAGRISQGIEGLAAVRSPVALGKAGLWTLLIWLVSGLAYYLVLRAFTPALSLEAGLFLLVVTTLIQIVPSTPGYVGVFDYTAMLTLTTLGVERNLALSCAIVLHAVAYITFCSMGLISLLQESISLSSMIRLNANKPE